MHLLVAIATALTILIACGSDSLPPVKYDQFSEWRESSDSVGDVFVAKDGGRIGHITSKRWKVDDASKDSYDNIKGHFSFEFSLLNITEERREYVQQYGFLVDEFGVELRGGNNALEVGTDADADSSNVLSPGESATISRSGWFSVDRDDYWDFRDVEVKQNRIYILNDEGKRLVQVSPGLGDDVGID